MMEHGKAFWREATDLIITQKNTQAEKEMILRRYPYYKNDMAALWDSLRKSGYTRSYCGMLRVIKKWVSSEIKKAHSPQAKVLCKGLVSGSEGAGRCEIRAI